MSEMIVGRWGKTLAVRLPAEVARRAGLACGERVEVSTEDDRIMIRKVTPPPSLDDLFRGRSAEAWRRIYARAYDWGPDIGREIVDA